MGAKLAAIRRSLRTKPLIPFTDPGATGGHGGIGTQKYLSDRVDSAVFDGWVGNLNVTARALVLDELEVGSYASLTIRVATFNQPRTPKLIRTLHVATIKGAARAIWGSVCKMKPTTHIAGLQSLSSQSGHLNMASIESSIV